MAKTNLEKLISEAASQFVSKIVDAVKASTLSELMAIHGEIQPSKPQIVGDTPAENDNERSAPKRKKRKSKKAKAESLLKTDNPTKKRRKKKTTSKKKVAKKVEAKKPTRIEPKTVIRRTPKNSFKKSKVGKKATKRTRPSSSKK